MEKALDLIEAGLLPHRHSHECVVVDEAGAAEVELSFFDYQRQAYIGENGLSPRPFFFPAQQRTLADGRAGYVVGPEVTRFLRRDARFGVASGEGRLGDLRCKARTYGADVAGESAISFGRTEKLSDPPPASSSSPSPPPESPERDKAGGTNSKGEALEASRRPSKGETAGTGPRRAAPSKAMLVAIAAIVLVAGLFPMLGLVGIIGWETSPDKTSFEGLAGGEFSPRQAEVSLRRAWYVTAIERLLFPRQDPFVHEGAPEWLKFESAYYDEATDSWRLRVSPSGAASHAAEGEYAHRLDLRFPLAPRTYKGTEISLRVGHAEPKLTVSPSEDVVFPRFSEEEIAPAAITFFVHKVGPVSATWRVSSNVDCGRAPTAVVGSFAAVHGRAVRGFSAPRSADDTFQAAGTAFPASVWPER